MKSRNVILTLFLVLLLSGIFLCRKWQEPVRREALDRTPNLLTYSPQALCLLKCQRLNEEEVQKVLGEGIILLNKSERFRRPCPIFAVQGAITNRKSLRLQLEQCAKETKVMSCILVNQEFNCQCPGDMNK